MCTGGVCKFLIIFISKQGIPSLQSFCSAPCEGEVTAEGHAFLVFSPGFSVSSLLSGPGFMQPKYAIMGFNSKYTEIFENFFYDL